MPIERDPVTGEVTVYKGQTLGPSTAGIHLEPHHIVGRVPDWTGLPIVPEGRATAMPGVYVSELQPSERLPPSGDLASHMAVRTYSYLSAQRMREEAGEPLQPSGDLASHRAVRTYSYLSAQRMRDEVRATAEVYSPVHSYVRSPEVHLENHGSGYVTYEVRFRGPALHEAPLRDGRLGTPWQPPRIMETLPFPSRISEPSTEPRLTVWDYLEADS